MKIGLVVNDIKTEQAGYTTTRLGVTGINRGHEVWVMGLGDLAYDADENIRARARTVPKKQYKSNELYLNTLQGKNAIRNGLLLMNWMFYCFAVILPMKPVRDHGAATAGINFGRIAMRHGVIVFNDPNGLAKAVNKTYFQLFPEEVRPRTLITRNVNEIKQFAKEEGGNIVLKPLQGSGGSGVFLVRPDDNANLNQIVESLLRDGYIIAQEYLPAASEW